jgi:bifunctional ADP-heptose synthase (sugar kinase/adenylyltransferase)
MLNKVNTLKKECKIIGFTVGTFDLLHTGYCAMLAEAKSHYDFLIFSSSDLRKKVSQKENL